MIAATSALTASTTSEFPPSASSRLTPAAPVPFASSASDSPSSLSPVFTLVIWSGCLLVGGLGFVLPYSRPRPPAPAFEPVVAEKLVVELAPEPAPALTLPVDLSSPPPPASLAVPQEVAPPIAVAEPSAVAFALPVDGPTITVATGQAAHARPTIAATATVATGSPAPQTLVFGRGEGRQPAPEYPARSAKLGQEGVVDIRLTVDSSGKVTETLVAAPCAWPLLNDAAERTVRHRWRFPRGPVRIYDVAIRFTLAK